MAELSHIDTWVFDLDNTLYPRSCELFKQVDVQISKFVAQTYKIDDLVEAKRIQKQLFKEYGTTLRGLMDSHEVDPYEFIAFAHDIDYSPLTKLQELEKLNEAIAKLPGRKLIFTNADAPHVSNCLDKLGLEDHFEGVFDIIEANFVPKPQQAAYDDFCAKFDIDHSSTIMFEDMSTNLKVPKQFGWSTVFVGADGASLSEAWEHAGGYDDHIDYQTTNLSQFLRDINL